MESWRGYSVRDGVREICDDLVANKDGYNHLELQCSLLTEEFHALTVALKDNSTVESIELLGPDDFSFPHQFSDAQALCLSLAFISHRTLREISFVNVKFTAGCNSIWLAIIQNTKLNRLSMDDCILSPSVDESIATILSRNALECFEAKSCRDENDDAYALDLPNGLRSNHSLKELKIFEDDGREGAIVTSRALLDGVPAMLGLNRNIQKVHIDLCYVENPSDKVLTLVQGAKGHVSLNKLALTWCGEINENATTAICDLLLVRSALRELDLTGYDIGDKAEYLGKALTNENCCLKRLDLTDCSIGDSRITHLLAALERCSSLEEIDLSSNDIGDSGARSLASLIKRNKRIRKMLLGRNKIGPEGTAAIADALSSNSSLRTLDFRGNPSGDDGVTKFMQALCLNQFLESATLGRFDESGLRAIIDGIPRMSTLKTLCLTSGIPASNPGLANELLGAIDRNTSLSDFFISGQYSITGFAAKVHRLMDLNKAGRKILGSHDVPRSLWPLILAKSSAKPDVIFYFLQQKPDLFKKQSLLGKRKRDASSSCTIS